MFKKTLKSGSEINDTVDTIIGPSVKIEGDFKSQGNIVVGGQVVGKMSTTQNLKIDEGSNINADIQAKEAVIAGRIKGNITIEGHLEILSTARIDGDITTRSIAIQQGAYLNGKCTMTGTETSTHKDAEEKQETQADKKQLTEDWLKAHDEV